MSYDLHLHARDDAPPHEEELLGHLGERRHWTVEGRQASYENEATGVYFTITVPRPGKRETPGPAKKRDDRETEDEPVEADDDDDDEDDDDLDEDDDEDDDLEDEDDDDLEDDDGEAGGIGPLVATFNMNYFRPAVFALEAAPELAALVEAFDLVVDDPQRGGMGRGDFTSEGLVRGWKGGNAFACATFIESQGEEAVRWTLPAATLEAAWRWNLAKEDLQDAMGELDLTCFVPTIFFLEVEGEAGVRTGVVWGDGISIALPEVDLVLLKSEGRPPVAVQRASLDELLRRYKVRPAGERVRGFDGHDDVEHVLPLAWRAVDHEEVPEHILEELADLPGLGKTTRVPPDRVLEAEVVAAAKPSA